MSGRYTLFEWLFVCAWASMVIFVLQRIAAALEVLAGIK